MAHVEVDRCIDDNSVSNPAIDFLSPNLHRSNSKTSPINPYIAFTEPESIKKTKPSPINSFIATFGRTENHSFHKSQSSPKPASRKPRNSNSHFNRSQGRQLADILKVIISFLRDELTAGMQILSRNADRWLAFHRGLSECDVCHFSVGDENSVFFSRHTPCRGADIILTRSSH